YRLELVPYNLPRSVWFSRILWHEHERLDRLFDLSRRRGWYVAVPSCARRDVEDTGIGHKILQFARARNLRRACGVQCVCKPTACRGGQIAFALIGLSVNVLF